MKNLNAWRVETLTGDPRKSVAPARPELTRPEIEVFDAQGALSQEFLRQRGFCCGNGCKNCPYDFCNR